MNADMPPDATGAEAFAPAVDDEMLVGVPPRSYAAVGGFILAIVLLIPVVPFIFARFAGAKGLLAGAMVGLLAGLLAMLLGIVGILRTRRRRASGTDIGILPRRRRGRGLAIAAIPIGLVAGVLQAGVGATVYRIQISLQFSEQAMRLLGTSSGDVKDASAEWYAEKTSAQFQAACTPEEVAGWLRETLADRGQLQNAKKDREFIEVTPSAYIVKFNGNFVNGAAPVRVHVGLEGVEPKIDDLRIGESSPLTWKPSKSAEP